MICRPTPENIARAAELLRAGQLVALPTETVYGLGADASSAEASRQIFSAKGRPADHPLIVHLADAEQLTDWASEIPKEAIALARAFWPGPLTLILKKEAEVPDLVTGGQDTVGLRVPDHPVALALLDIDRFKDINDSLGHDRGDELLQQVATRLRDAMRQDDVVARLGGDEFAILFPDVNSAADAEAAARRVRQLFVPPFPLGDLALHVDSSIGVACLPDHAEDASSLMRMADVAMYTAKTHRLGVSVYSPEEDDSSPARLVLLGDLHRALSVDDELQMHYQPKIDLNTGQTIGLEALMRWRHPTRGMLPPDLFIPLAEQSGLIHDLTRYALRSCVAQIAAWSADRVPVPVAVNLSAHDVTAPDVVAVFEDLLTLHRVPVELLEVEITETALVSDPSRVVPVLHRLGEIGVRVAIDDFGIGNTSISQLRDLPVHGLKIDRLFVADLATTGKRGSEVVVKAMVDLAHSFGLQVVAEGVEDETTAEALRQLTVDQAQGYLYAPALPAERLGVEHLRRLSDEKSDTSPQVARKSGR